MSVLMVLRVALKALGRNKMRTSLTMLGMIIGVAAVITMVALGRGAQQEIETQIKAAGTNMIMVRAGNYRRGGISMGMGQSPRLKAQDVEAIRERVPDAQYLAAGVRTRDQVVAAGQNWNTTIQGTDIEFPQIRFWDIQLGTFFTTTHVQSAAKVALLGSVVRDNLFGEGVDPVGARIRIRNQSFPGARRHGRKGFGTVRRGPGRRHLRPLHHRQQEAARTGRYQHLRDHDLGRLRRSYRWRRRRDNRGAARGAPPRPRARTTTSWSARRRT